MRLEFTITNISHCVDVSTEAPLVRDSQGLTPVPVSAASAGCVWCLEEIRNTVAWGLPRPLHGDSHYHEDTQICADLRNSSFDYEHKLSR